MSPLLLGILVCGAVVMFFTAGAAVGIFLEYWGTSRHCWTYWTKEIPPAEAVLAHGFASVAFARGVQLLTHVATQALTIARRLRGADRSATSP